MNTTIHNPEVWIVVCHYDGNEDEGLLREFVSKSAAENWASDVLTDELADRVSVYRGQRVNANVEDQTVKSYVVTIPG